LRGLDGSIFFVADVQTGFGPLFGLSPPPEMDAGRYRPGPFRGGLVALAGADFQASSGRFCPLRTLVAGFAVAAISVSALAYAALADMCRRLSAAVLHSAPVACSPGPLPQSASVWSDTRGRERLGRNAGSRPLATTGAAANGCLRLLSLARAVFFVTALLLAPAIIALRAMSANEIDPERAHGGVTRRRDNRPPSKFSDLLASGPLLVLASASCCSISATPPCFP